MTEKSTIIQYLDAIDEITKLKSIISDEVISIFNKYNSEGLYNTTFDMGTIYVDLNEKELINTKVVEDLNKYFNSFGTLGYRNGDFSIEYKLKICDLE